ncbi:hypothetical protein FS749_000961 [Ceratobasidium sp. UAMH 11750]|nr:hypothetical protein FS749_000961 [Ceratobasidium sp. UAMH 11750]
MPRETKKRKLDAAGASSSESSSASGDVKQFRKDLTKCNASALIQALSNSLDDMPPETLHTLRNVLGPLLDADAQPKHCIRCHKAFREEKNTRKSCIVLCGDDYRMTSHEDEEYDCYNMVEFTCCGKLRSEGDLEDDEELVCYTAEHTTDPGMVKYYTRDSSNKATKEKGVNYGGRNPNVRTCKIMGCGKGNSKK